MAKRKKKQKKDPAVDQPQPDSIDRSDTSRHATGDARAAAIEKMKAAQAEEAASTSDELSANNQEDDDKLVKSQEIDPKAKKALLDLLGADEKKGDTPKTLRQVKVYSPFRVYYDSEAQSVSAVNHTGPFDVLPGHKNFLSLLSPGDIAVRSATGKEETITIDRGVMHVHNNRVLVFLDV